MPTAAQDAPRGADAAVATPVAPPAAATLDERVRTWWQAAPRQSATAWRFPMRAADLAASPGLVVAAPVVWGYAALADAPVTAHVASRTTDAIAIGVLTTSALKWAFGRTRPYVGRGSRDWRAGRGASGEDHRAFPSGHTTVAFAAATSWVLTAEPGARGGVAIGAGVLAAAAGAARMYFDQHWLTDVLAGAAVGTASAFAARALSP